MMGLAELSAKASSEECVISRLAFRLQTPSRSDTLDMMASRAVLLLGSCAFALGLNAPAPDAVLLVDRGLPGAISQAVSQRVGWNVTGGVFVTDHFVIGQRGESWVIDRIRTWGVPGLTPGGNAALGDLFERVALYGGLESETAPADEEAAGAVCACHGPVALASSELRRGTNVAENEQVLLTPVTYTDGSSHRDGASLLQLWQIEFQNLRWTLPGGASVQFGVFGLGRLLAGNPRRPAWFSHASTTGGKHAFRLFETSGKPVVPASGSLPQDESLGVNVQVWGHLLVNLAIRPAGKTLEVVLRGSPTLDVSRVDLGSLRFGPKGAVPHRKEVGNFGGDGSGDLMLRVGVAESGVQSTQRVACLTGRLSDGVPFEGCDLVTVSAKRL